MPAVCTWLADAARKAAVLDTGGNRHSVCTFLVPVSFRTDARCGGKQSVHRSRRMGHAADRERERIADAHFPRAPDLDFT